MRKQLFFVITAIAAIAGITFATSPAQAEPAAQHLKGQILVKFKPTTLPNAAADIAREHSARVGAEVAGTGVRVLSVPAGKEAELVEKLSRNPRVEFAELDSLGEALTDDTYFGRQYALENTGQSFTNTTGTTVIAAGTPDADIDAPEAWTITRGADAKIAVLDSGIDTNHEDISSKVIDSRNFTTATTGTEDIYGHGTHVAGIVAASTGNTTGVAGACPDCSVLNGKVLNDSGSAAVSWVANGITWAADQGADVANLSLGFNRSSRTLQTAVNNAWNRGVVIVAAAGNSGNTAKLYPAAYPNVIAVAATNSRDQKASFSTYGAKWVDIAAPGENVYSTFPNHPFEIQRLYGRSLNYDVANGTSMSSPIVAAVAGLVSAQSPTASATTVRERVESTADPIAGTGKLWANGRVNAARAVGYPVTQ